LTTSWARFLQTFSSPFLDQTVYLITNFGSELFYTVALPAIYWVWNKRSGYRLTLVFLFSVYLNSFLKFMFHTPRPSSSVSVRIIHPETGQGYAFPSGHAQGSTVFWGWMGTEIRRKWFYFLAAIMIFLVSLSRIYLNVHWPVDVVGGIVIGLLLIKLWQLFFTFYDESKWPDTLRVIGAISLPLFLYALHHTEDVHMLVGFLMGLSLGKFFEGRYLSWSERASWQVQILKVLAGMAGFMILRLGLKIIFPDIGLFHVFRYCIIGMWVSFGAPWIYTRLGWGESVDDGAEA